MTETMVICKEDVDNDVVQLTNAVSTPSPSTSPTGSSKNKRPRLTFPFGACRVCTDSATGVHYGIATCEGCKGFFKRSILRKEKYRCYFDNACLINVTNRNRCKACRFRRCISEGMSVDGVKMGRIPKLVKERALRELKEKQMRQEASLIEVNERADEVHARESSCSSLSDQSTENCDPDIMELGTSHYPISSARRAYGSAKFCTDNSSTMNPHALLVNEQRFNRSANLSQFDINSSSHVSQHASHSLVYRTNYPSFLPEDFHLDESVGLSEHSTGPLSHDVFKHVITVSDKLSQNKNLIVHLDEDESTFIRFLRWSSYSVYVRYSKRVKQLETRMEYMVREGIRDFPGDNASSEEFFGAVRDTLTALVRSTVFHTQELPGMTNMDSSVLQKLILHRSFDWFMLKYARLLHKNGQFYFVAPNGFQCTRRWMNIFYGVDMTNAMFEFSQCFHELNLDESELALIIPLQMLHPDPTIADEEIPRMLRACYLYALYEELCLNRGEAQGRLLCSKVLQMLDRLVPLNYLYGKNVGSRVLQE